MVFEKDCVQRWEWLPDGSNRKYKVRYPKSQVHSVESDPIVREIVLEATEESSLEICKFNEREYIQFIFKQTQ